MVLPAPGSVRFLGKDGKAVGGDAVTSLAVGTATAASPADSAYGATAGLATGKNVEKTLNTTSFK